MFAAHFSRTCLVASSLTSSLLPLFHLCSEPALGARVMNHSASQHLAVRRHLPFYRYLFPALGGKYLFFFFFLKKEANCLGFKCSKYVQPAQCHMGENKNNFFLFTPAKGFPSKWKESFPAAYVDKRSATVGTFIKSTPGALITATPRIKQHNTCVAKDTLMDEGHNMLIYTVLWEFVETESSRRGKASRVAGSCSRAR